MEGKAALVTGAASRLGLATAKAFVEAGAAVAMADWDEQAVTAAAEQLKAESYQMLAIKCDVSDDQSVAAMVKQTADTFGRLDYAYNNAGVQNELADAAYQTMEDFEK
ncbi:MAG: short chain dehydrogenase [Mucilaginibacter sp.]|nr:short chain dehydrogenase [Mucilaginibacter sp.]